MRLSIAAMNYYPVYSGAAMRFKRYIPGFMAREIDVRVCAGTPERARAAASDFPRQWNDFRHGAFLPEETVEGVPVHRVRLPDGSGVSRDAWFAWRVADLCQSNCHRPDVMQLFSLPPATIPGLMRIRRLGVPTVATQTVMPSPSAQPFKRAVLGGALRLAARLVTCVVTSSEVMLGAFRELGITGRIEVIPHGVDLGRFRPSRQEGERLVARRRLAIPDDDLLVLFVGSLTPRKGIHLLLRAWCELAARHPRLHLALIGPRPQATGAATIQYYRELDALVDRSGARDRFHFLGRVQDVETYMRSSDLFVFPSMREGMPNAVLEAMATGVPVVTTPFLGLPREFGEPGRHFALTTFDPAQIALDVSALLEAPERRAEIAQNARLWVEDHLDVRMSLDRYAELYRELAPSRAASAEP